MIRQVDEEILAIKKSIEDNSLASLKEGYYISAKLETFTKSPYFNDTVTIYTPSSFIDMPDEIKEIKYPTGFRPEVIKTNLQEM